MGLYDFGLYHALKRNAGIYRDDIALISDGSRITFCELLEKVDRLAFGLLARGLHKGDRIGVIGLNCPEYIYLYGAAAKLGVVVLAVNWRLSPGEVKYIISDGTPRIIFVESRFQDSVGSLLPELSFVEQLYGLPDGEGTFKPFNTLMGDKAKLSEPEGSVDEPFVIIHTAAVAGKARGATISQKGAICFNLILINLLKLSELDCNLGMLPLFHVGGLSTTLAVMQAGGTNIILPKFDIDLALDHIERDRVTLFGEFPPMLDQIMDRAAEKGRDLSSLKAVLGIEKPETIRRLERETNARYWISYGQTETSGLVSLSPYSDRPGSAGKPVLIADVGIEDESGRMVGPGVPGEIVVRGPLVFKGYWKMDKDTAWTFRGGWHHTGDMGHFDEDGYLWYSGRLPEKELIKPGGENVYPAEVEESILKHPSVKEASVIGVRDARWGEAIKAVCVLKPGEPLEPSELIEFVGSMIARFKKPQCVMFVPELPKREDGSIDRTKVKMSYGDAT